jgi:hypothetical protein
MEPEEMVGQMSVTVSEGMDLSFYPYTSTLLLVRVSNQARSEIHQNERVKFNMTIS